MHTNSPQQGSPIEPQSAPNYKLIGIIAVVVVIALGGFGWWFLKSSNKGKQGAPIQVNNQQKKVEEDLSKPANTGNVSPISGLACDNWNKRAIAVMQPADVQARPAAGFSEADLVFELPAFTGSNTRLMGVYQCNIPKEIGAIRSARHDYIHLAKGVDAVFVHWGYSKFAEGILDKKVIDNINCITTSYCNRWKETGKMRYEDTGHITDDSISQAMKNYGYSMENKFSGYPHQEDVSVDKRPSGGNLRVAFPNPYDVEYNYDKESNSYLRLWDDENDTDRNNARQIAPKNVVVMIAKSEQIKLDIDFKSRGVQDPWELVPEEEKEGLNYGGIGRYNNMELGDPWFDVESSGDAYFYMNGQEIKGKWKKDKSKIDSKLVFLDDQEQAIKFVPGQIWVDILEPGQGLRWKPQP